MSWLNLKTPKYPHFFHGEHLNRELLISLRYPEFITDYVNELSNKHFYWLSGRKNKAHYESEVIVYGLQIPDYLSEQFIMYITNSLIYLYHYKLDITEEITRGKAELTKTYSERVNTFKKMASPKYIKDEESRQKVLTQAQESLKEVENEWNEYNAWESISGTNWYRRLYEDPFSIEEGDDVNLLIQLASALYQGALNEWGTSQISVIGI